MLKLAGATAAAWVEVAVGDVETLLVDHAHLEKKAAGTAVTLLFRYPDCAALQAPLAELAREELDHFAAVLGLMERRGISLRRIRASPYAGRLHREIRGPEPDRLIDTLLVAALIEARSCERMQCFAAGVAERDPELAAFYRELLATEARHHGVYVALAEELGGPGPVRPRLEVLARREAEIIAELGRAPVLHG